MYFEDNQGSFGSLISSWKVMLASSFAGLVFIRGSQWSGVFYRENVSCWVSEKNSLYSCKRCSRTTEWWWLIWPSNTCCLPDVRNLCKWKLQMTFCPLEQVCLHILGYSRRSFYIFHLQTTLLLVIDTLL